MNTNNNYKIYRGEDAPKYKDCIWIHHIDKGNLKSSIIAEVYSNGAWTPIADELFPSGVDIATLMEIDALFGLYNIIGSWD